MPHDHAHPGAGAGDRRVGLAVAVNLLLTAAQVAGGILSGSLALIADAVHNLSDAMALVIALVARRIARRPADAEMTWGYARAETVAALVNYTTLILIGLWLAWEAVLRFVAPEPVAGWTVVIVAGIAFVVDAVTVALTFRLAKGSMNIRAAYLHNLADMFGSVAVIVAGTLILLKGWHIVDPIVTLGIAGYILWHALAEIGPVIRLLMSGRPPGIAAEAALDAIRGEAGVQNVYHLHLWQMQEGAAALTAHVTLAPGRWGEADAIKARLKDRLAAMGIRHSTLELECARHAVAGRPAIGHGAEG